MSSIYLLTKNPLFLLGAIFFSSAVKIYLVGFLMPHVIRSAKRNTPWLFLLGVLVGAFFGDIAWLVKLVRSLTLIDIPYSTFVFFVRMSWGFLIIQYQSLIFFIESLTKKTFRLNLFHKILLGASGFLAGYFFLEAFFDNTLTDEATRTAALNASVLDAAPLEMKMTHYVSIYLFHILVLPGLLVTLWQLHTTRLPKILSKQLKTVITYFMCPYLFIEALQAAQVLFPVLYSNQYAIVACSSILITCATTFCISRLMGLRFLNSNDNVESTYNDHFLTYFKHLLEGLSQTSQVQQFSTLLQLFFHKLFNLEPNTIKLIVRNQKPAIPLAEICATEKALENFLHHNHQQFTDFINHHKIIIYDDLEFSNFYEHNLFRQNLLTLLANHNIDIFLPIYDKQSLSAYIIIEQSSTKRDLYGHAQRDEMLMLAQYMSTIINLLENRTLKNLMHKEKELKDDLFQKHQEIHQYKESLKLFLRDSHHKEIGFIFYKNSRFVYGNKAAKDFIAINLNLNDDHHIAKAVRHVVETVAEYSTPYKQFTIDSHGKKIVLYGVSNLEKSTIIIMIYYPEMSDLVTRTSDLLKDPTFSDYALYLETTQSGQLINQLIPGKEKTVLPLKIDLLALALSQKALLLELPDHDLMPTVDIIHHITRRKDLHVLSLTKKQSVSEQATTLFGAHHLFGSNAHTVPLLSRLDQTGTLLIKNIDYLALDLQKDLAEFIKYGVYRRYKSDERISCDVRIIGSCTQDIEILVEKGLFSRELFQELKKISLTMPSLQELSSQELYSLTLYSEQHAFNRSETDVRSAVLRGLCKKIKDITVDTSNTPIVYQETQLDPTLELTDPEVLQACKLGKKALRDVELMTILWRTFKNQNKIALLLGVNRSSINRRCKAYNLQ